MKYLFIAVALLLALPAFSQLNYWTDGADTSGTSVTLTGGGVHDYAFYYDVNIDVDLIQSAGANVYVEHKPLGSSTWYQIKAFESISADGDYRHTGYALAGTLRVTGTPTETDSTIALTQNVITSPHPSKGMLVEYWSDGPDTSVAAAVNLAGGGVIDEPFYYDLNVYVDEIGTDTAQLYIQYQPKGASVWQNIDTTANITADTYYQFQGSTLGGKIRVQLSSDEADPNNTAATVNATYARKED